MTRNMTGNMTCKWMASLGLAAAVSLVASAAVATPIVSAKVQGYDLVKVGNPGNAGQTQTYASGGELTFGAVGYEYWIGRNEVTIGQYAEFLNAVAKFGDPRGLWQAGTGTVFGVNDDARIRGIERTGSGTVESPYVYSPIGPDGSNPAGAQSAANRPMTYVSWFDAARYANWMSNGKVLNPANEAAALLLIDNGAYNLGTATNGNRPAKNEFMPGTTVPPTFYIPTENEWYKAAYYDPTKDDGGKEPGGYWAWATGRFNEEGVFMGPSLAPGNGWNGSTTLASKDLPNQANYRNSNFYAVSRTTDLTATSDQNALTDVGTFTNSYSYYGAYDMTGSLLELVDADAASERVLLGGSFFQNNNASAVNVSSSVRNVSGNTGLGGFNFGFRLASPVPEPATLGMAAGGALCAAGWWVRQRRRRACT